MSPNMEKQNLSTRVIDKLEVSLKGPKRSTTERSNVLKKKEEREEMWRDQALVKLFVTGGSWEFQGTSKAEFVCAWQVRIPPRLTSLNNSVSLNIVLHTKEDI